MKNWDLVINRREIQNKKTSDERTNTEETLDLDLYRRYRSEYITRSSS